MKVERAEIERLLQTAEGVPGIDYRLHGLEVIALCRAWLAVDAAPEVDVGFSLADELKGSGVDFYGQRVRLVATPATRGPSDE